MTYLDFFWFIYIITYLIFNFKDFILYLDLIQRKSKTIHFYVENMFFLDIGIMVAIEIMFLYYYLFTVLQKLYIVIPQLVSLCFIFNPFFGPLYNVLFKF